MTIRRDAIVWESVRTERIGDGCCVTASCYLPERAAARLEAAMAERLRAGISPADPFAVHVLPATGRAGQLGEIRFLGIPGGSLRPELIAAVRELARSA